MSRSFLMVMTLFCLNSLNGQSTQVQPHLTRYYSTIAFTETPLSELKGSVPLSREVAMLRNHYRFVYDEMGRVLSIAFFNGRAPRRPNHTANLFTLSHRMDFIYEDRRQRVVFYDIDQKPISVLGECREFIYSLNEKGYRNGLVFMDKNKKQIENSWNIFRYEWVYQKDGSVIEERFDKNEKPVSIRPGFDFYRLKLFFNPMGHIALMQQIDENGQLLENNTGAAQDRISVSAEGHFLQWTVLDREGNPEKGNGPNVAIGIQGFNAFGYETSLEHQDESGEPIYNSYGICRSRTTFDKFGNISERRFYNKQNKPGVHANAGYHRLQIEWGASGNQRRSLTYFGLQDEPVNHQQRGYHQARYSYDEQGKLVQLSYFDTSGNPVNRHDNGIAVIKYMYHPTGRLKEQVSVDNEGNIVSKR